MHLSKLYLIFAALNKTTQQTMKKILKANVEGFGKVRLELQEEDYYIATDENDNFMGEIHPDEIEDWSEDNTILSSIIEDLIDDGTLEVAAFDREYCGDFDD